MSRFHHPNLVYLHQFGIPAKNCPFCKSDNLMMSITHEPHVSCMFCGADGPRAKPGDDPRIAINMWNLTNV